MNLMDERRAARAGQADDAPPARPGPIAGPPRLPALSPYALAAVVAVVAVAALVLLPGLLAPPARPALDPTVPTSHPSIPADRPSGAVTTEAPRPGPLAILATGATAYDAPDGAALGDVGGRIVFVYLERQSVEWMRVEVEGSGPVWVKMGALAGNAVDLAVIPCRGTCLSPTATAVYVAPPPPPPPPAHVVATLEAPAAEVEVVERTDGPVPLPPTPCPVVMTSCQAPLVVAP